MTERDDGGWRRLLTPLAPNGAEGTTGDRHERSFGQRNRVVVLILFFSSTFQFRDRTRKKKRKRAFFSSLPFPHSLRYSTTSKDTAARKRKKIKQILLPSNKKTCAEGYFSGKRSSFFASWFWSDSDLICFSTASSANAAPPPLLQMSPAIQSPPSVRQGNSSFSRDPLFPSSPPQPRPDGSSSFSPPSPPSRYEDAKWDLRLLLHHRHRLEEEEWKERRGRAAGRRWRKRDIMKFEKVFAAARGPHPWLDHFFPPIFSSFSGREAAGWLILLATTQPISQKKEGGKEGGRRRRRRRRRTGLEDALPLPPSLPAKKATTAKEDGLARERDGGEKEDFSSDFWGRIRLDGGGRGGKEKEKEGK